MSRISSAWVAVAWGWEKFLEAALNEPFTPGTGYEDNFRKGSIAKSKAAQIADWLQRTHPELHAKAIEAAWAVLEAAEEEDINAWDHLVASEGLFSNVRLVPLAEREFRLIKPAPKEPVEDYRLKPSEAFCFELESPCDGSAIAFQQYHGKWHAIALGGDTLSVAMTEGTQIIPRDSGTGGVISLSEEEDFDRHKIVFVIADDEAIADMAGAISSAEILSPAILAEVAKSYNAAQPDRALLCINLMFQT